ncbi:alpha-S2-casein-like A [Meriones unguiculatus]|uniref:alpha-S2-casein-like A n=1 Tax=Meriones unguiculatus TaxID=10047 RepID=UPI00293F752B|nr:alpha-S2-casein-like A [Meriones unguiculatus]
MKFFIFTCLVAVALASHAIKEQSSSEKYKQGSNVFFQTTQDSASSSSSEESADDISEKIVQSRAQKVNLSRQKKIKPQGISIPQCCTPFQQQQAGIQWDQSKTIRNIPIQESPITSVEEILKKIIDMVKFSQLQQVTIPQFPQAVHTQIPVNYWNPNEYPTAPYARYVRYF